VIFFAAHALLFKLHVPSRYTGMSLRIMALAAGMAFLVILDAVFHWAQQPNPACRHSGGSWHWGSCLSRAALVLYPSFVKAFH